MDCLGPFQILTVLNKAIFEFADFLVRGKRIFQVKTPGTLARISIKTKKRYFSFGLLATATKSVSCVASIKISSLKLSECLTCGEYNNVIIARCDTYNKHTTSQDDLKHLQSLFVHNNEYNTDTATVKCSLVPLSQCFSTTIVTNYHRLAFLPLQIRNSYSVDKRWKPVQNIHGFCPDYKVRPLMSLLL